MKRITRYIFLLMCWLSPIVCPAQKHDNTWIMGYYYTPNTFVCGLDFYYGSPDTVGFNPPFSFIGSGAVNMSDDNGTLQFYTNGEYMGNYNNQFLANSTNFNYDPGSVGDYWQGMFSVPYPGQPNKYFLAHMNGVSYTYNGSPAFGPKKLYYSVVDMNANNGLGNLSVKKQIVYTDTILPCVIQGTRHANGRDWWIVNHKAYSNKFIVSLLTPNGIVQNTTIATGPSLTFFSISEGQSEFSPDGSQFAIAYNTFNSVYLFDFDRCTGTIAFRDSIHIIPNDASEWPVWGCSFSPNSRFLYANTNNDLYQIDTWANPIDSGMKLVAVYDGFVDFVSTYFFRQRLGPDGKIYMIPWGGSYYLHVINDPDQADTLCNVGQHQLQLSNYVASVIPDFPNYRLTNLPGSACDTLTDIISLEDPQENIKLYPNPNTGNFMVSYALPPNTEGILMANDLLGRPVYRRTLSAFTTSASVTLEGLASGVYELVIQGDAFRNSSRFIVSSQLKQ